MKSSNLRTCFAIFSMLSATIATEAQDFEADSIYYSPIPKTSQSVAKKAPRKIFNDTTTISPRFQYFFNFQVGSLIGCNDCSSRKDVTFTSSTLHGVTVGRKLRGGLGIGFDSYVSWQTLPMYGSISWDLLGTKNTQALFIQFDYGWSKAWRQADEAEFGLKETEGGKMYNALIGYRIKYHDLKIGLAFGSKFQEAFSYYEFPTYYYTSDGIMMEGSPNTMKVKREMNRLMFTLSVGWR